MSTKLIEFSYIGMFITGSGMVLGYLDYSLGRFRLFFCFSLSLEPLDNRGATAKYLKYSRFYLLFRYNHTISSAPRANKTGFNLKVFLKNVHGKLSMINAKKK